MEVREEKGDKEDDTKAECMGVTEGFNRYTVVDSDKKNKDSWCKNLNDDDVPFQKLDDDFYLESDFGSSENPCSVIEDALPSDIDISSSIDSGNCFDPCLELEFPHSVTVPVRDKERCSFDSDASGNGTCEEIALKRENKHCVGGNELTSLKQPTFTGSVEQSFRDSLPQCDKETVDGRVNSDVSYRNNYSVSNTCSELSTKRGGFSLLNSFESDSFDCDSEPMTFPECEENAGSKLRKRNRQISTDSSSSVVVEVKGICKSTKKPKKKERKKRDVDEEIEKILTELELGIKVSVTEERGTETLVADTGSLENIPTDKKKKKKKKKHLKSNEKNLDTEVCDISNETSSDNLCASVMQIEEHTEKNKAKSSEKSTCVNEGTDISPSSCSNKNSMSTSIESKNSCLPQSKIEQNDEKKDRKKPGKKQLAAMQAAIKKAKDEEEKLLQEELARQKKAEEMERSRLEKLRLERERKEKKKQREKDRKERLKAEGKFLTKSQKVARARLEAALSAWREHGIEVPNVVTEKTLNHETKASQKKRPYVKHVFQKEGSEQSSCNEFPENTQMKTISPRQRHLTDPKLCGSNNDAPRSAFSEISVQRSESLRTRTRSESDVVVKNKESNRKLLFKGSKELYEVEQKQSESIFRSPVVCVLGHVDTGKTKILDKIRKTHVQDNEAGGITQQIGATMVPIEALKEKCSMVKGFADFDLQLPGLLIIDTPGHESFRNLRSRGSSLCDISILVVDVMHGLEPQTIESIDLLKQKKTPFVVALNKIDRLYGWETDASSDIEEVISRQGTVTVMELDKRCKQVIAEFANEGLNAALFYENPDPRSYLSLVPVSAVSGDGMGNLLAVVSRLCQNMMSKRLTFSEELEATVLEVKATAGLGTTIDVILVNGQLRETDTIVLVGQDGPIVTQIRSLLMPQPLRELRVKNPYQEFKVVKGAQGVKVSGKDLEKAIAGLPLFVSRFPDEVPTLKEKAMRLYRQTINSIKLSERGVYVQASTLGSLEALLDFLKTSSIPYAGVKVGPVVKKDVIKASVMLEHDVLYAVILAFDVKIERDAQELADHLGIKIFQADIIYHLFDNFIQYKDELHEKKMNELKKFVVFPCKLSILPHYIFNIRNPIVIGVHVDAGVLRVGTPLCVPSKNFLYLGTVNTIEVQHQPVESAKEGDDVCITIEPCGEESPKSYGRHFDHTDVLVSRISRQTIDVCKEYYRNDLQKSDWHLMVELKKLFLIA